MYDYVTEELPALLTAHFPQLDLGNSSIMGHSMVRAWWLGGSVAWWIGGLVHGAWFDDREGEEQACMWVFL